MNHCCPLCSFSPSCNYHRVCAEPERRFRCLCFVQQQIYFTDSLGRLCFYFYNSFLLCFCVLLFTELLCYCSNTIVLRMPHMWVTYSSIYMLGSVDIAEEDIISGQSSISHEKWKCSSVCELFKGSLFAKSLAPPIIVCSIERDAKAELSNQINPRPAIA